MVAIVFFNGSEQEGRENFKTLLDIGAMSFTPRCTNPAKQRDLTFSEHIVDGTKEIPYELLNSLQVESLSAS